MFLYLRALATPVAGRAQCTLARSPGVRCFLQHIGAAGFRVKRALCQEAVRIGWVVFQTTHGSQPSPLPSPHGVSAMGQDSSTTHKRTPSPIVYPSVPTERISPRPITPSSPILQNPEVITTVTVTTTIIDDLTSVPVDKSSAVTSVFTKTVSPSESYCVSNRAPTSSEDPVGGEGTEKSSATAIYAGVGGVVVTVLLVAAFGVLIFGRRKWMQRLDLSPTPDEIVQINIVT
ncbi:uncharacterized protein isoform X6 [Salmo salar]|uniref:Uncharacterized protein isoform X6 n=1 Tax=Salmo salar TaxID=8030 RepID=A0ABM3DAE6_SALSA|nr:uncharacterized protein LOC106576191 isoform X6 [Salmo salar]